MFIPNKNWINLIIFLRMHQMKDPIFRISQWQIDWMVHNIYLLFNKSFHFTFYNAWNSAFKYSDIINPSFSPISRFRELIKIVKGNFMLQFKMRTCFIRLLMGKDTSKTPFSPHLKIKYIGMGSKTFKYWTWKMPI